MRRLWRELVHGLRALLWRRDDDRDVAEELRHYLDEALAERIAAGASPEDARRAVRLEYGDGLAAREDVSRYGWENTVEALLSDVRLSARRLRQSPGHAVVAILTLALGVGAATAIFSVVRPVLLEPLPYPDADRVLTVYNPLEDGTAAPVAFGTYRELLARDRVFESLSVFKPWQPTLAGGKEPERLHGQRVSSAYFEVLGVATVLGPGFDPTADRPAGGDEVVLSDGLWRRAFGADPGMVGRTIHLDGRSFTVVGVLPPSFENVTAPGAQAWALLQYDPATPDFDSREWGLHLGMVGRLRSGLDLEDARRELTAVASQPVPEHPRPGWASLERGLGVRSLRDATMVAARPTMWVLSGAVALLLTIACVNLTILTLAWTSRRRGELAVRWALGAGRGRLVRQLLTESLMLAVLGGVVALGVAEIGRSALLAVGPPDLPRPDRIRLDAQAFGFAMAVATLVGAVVGLVPALRSSRSDSLRYVHGGGRGTVGGGRSARRALVVTEVALAVVLLTGAGLLFRSTQRLFAEPTGFDASQLVVLQVSATGLEPGDAGIHRFFEGALEAVRRVPGVTSAALTSQLPLSGESDTYGLTLDEANRPQGADGPVFRYAVSVDHLRTMRIPVLRGRDLETGDRTGTPRVAVVSESLAGRLYPEGDPVGARIRIGPPELEPYTIVGVAGNVKQESLAARQSDAVYVPAGQWHWADRVRWIVVRSEPHPQSLVPALRGAIWSVDGDQPIVRTLRMESLVVGSEARRGFILVVLGAFASLALTLAGIGLYGVLARSVAERAREMGVRAALGASRERILTLVVRQGMAWAAAGAAVGLGAAALTGDLLATLLYQVSPVDSATYLVVTGVLAVVAAVACLVPGYRAARADPLRTLRTD